MFPLLRLVEERLRLAELTFGQMFPLLRLVELTFGQMLPLLRLVEERLRLVELTFSQIIPLLRLVEVSGGFKKVSGGGIKRKRRLNKMIMCKLHGHKRNKQRVLKAIIYHLKHTTMIIYSKTIIMYDIYSKFLVPFFMPRLMNQ
jgi:hypothetical protein